MADFKWPPQGGSSGGVSSLNLLTGALVLTSVDGSVTITPSGSTIDLSSQKLVTGNLTDVGTDGITITGGTGAVIGSGTSIAQQVADTTHNGYLSATDWNTFNGKQASGSYITALTGDGTASGPGSSALTLSTVNSNVGSFTYSSITVNAKGLITAASSGAAPVTTLAAVGSTPSANGASISGNTLTLQPFDGTHPGVVTASAGGTANFLRADGTWAAPAGTAGFIYQSTGSAYGGTNSTLSFTGIDNTIVGQGAAAALTSGTDNTLYGKGAGGTSLTTNTKHVVIGSAAVVGTGQEDVVIGYTATSASTTTGTSVIIGSTASTSGTAGTAVAIGRGAVSAVGVAVGFGAQMTGSGIILGKNSTHAASNTILIGNALSSAFNNTFIAGQSGVSVTPATAANQVVFGVSGGALKDLWLGQGAAAVAGTPSSISIQGTGVVTTSNQVGGDFTMSAPNGTGTGGSGKLIFRTSPVGSTGAVANTITQVGQIDNTGAWTLGAASTSPAHLVNGSIGLNGSSSGVVSVKTQAAAGTFNFNLPTTAGTAGQALLSGGGVASPMTWGSPSAAANAVTKTSAYSAVINDYISVSNSGASYAITLPTAVGVGGQSIWLVRTDNAISNPITINTTSAQTVGGYASGVATLVTLNEAYQFTSDGANWQITNHGTNTGWSTPVATYISASQAYVFTVTAANATSGAVYSNNGFQYIVNGTIAAGLTLTCSGTGAPLTSGTLTKVSGTGDATITFASRTVTGVPVKGNSGSPLVDSQSWRRVGGDSVEVRLELYQTVAGSNGTGDMVFYTPTGINVDTTFVTPQQTSGSLTSVSALNSSFAEISGYVSVTNGGSYALFYGAPFFGPNAYRVSSYFAGATNTNINNSTGSLNTAVLSYGWVVRFKVAGWTA